MLDFLRWNNYNKKRNTYKGTTTKTTNTDCTEFMQITILPVWCQKLLKSLKQGPWKCEIQCNELILTKFKHTALFLVFAVYKVSIIYISWHAIKSNIGNLIPRKTNQWPCMELMMIFLGWQFSMKLLLASSCYIIVHSLSIPSKWVYFFLKN